MLRQRHVIADASCPVCESVGETFFHAMWGCPWVKKVWKLGGFKALIKKFTDGDIIGMLLLASTELKVSDFEFFIIIMWELWNHRNNVCSGKKAWKPGELLEWSASFLRDYRNACAGVKQEQAGARQSRWSPPPIDVVAISVDAAVRAENRRVGLGIMARDSKGVVLGAETTVLHLGLSPQVAEASAVFHGMLFALDKGWSRIVIQSDCMEVISAIQKRGARATELGTVLNDIFILVSRFENISFIFHPRGCNKAAHVLASYACNFVSGASWSDSAPPCVLHEAESDLRGISP